MDVDIFDSLCRIGQTAERIATKLGTVTLQVVTRVWHGCIFSSVAESVLTTNIKHCHIRSLRSLPYNVNSLLIIY